MMDDMLDEGLKESTRRAAGLLRQDVPVRAAWRDDLLARIEADRAAKPRRRFEIGLPLAIAAGLVMLATGYAIGRGSGAVEPSRDSIGAASAQSVIRFVHVAPNAARVSIVG